MSNEPNLFELSNDERTVHDEVAPVGEISLRSVKCELIRACCYDCGLSYSDPGFCDLVVSNNIWELLNPTNDRGAGLLCPNCMVRRAEALGLENVFAKFTSGPFAVSF